MQKGLITTVRDVGRELLFKGWGNSGLFMDKVPTDPVKLGGEVMRPGDFASIMRAYKGLTYALSNVRADAMGFLPLRVYLLKKNNGKKKLTYTITREVSRKRKDEIFEKAIPGSTVDQAVDLEEVIFHPLVDLLRNVNGWMSSFDLKHLTTIYLDYTGNCYWCLIRNKYRSEKHPRGIPVAIWIVPSQNMEIVPDKEKFIKHYRYKKGDKEVIYQPEDIIHFKLMGLKSQYYGESRVEKAYQSYNLREYMYAYETSIFQSGGMAKQILVPKSRMNKKEMAALKKRWAEIGNGELAVANDDFELKEPKFSSSREMGYTQGMRETLSELARVMKVPKGILETEDVNRANAEVAEYILAKYGLAPDAGRIDQKLTEQLAPQFSDQLAIVFDNPVPEDRQFIQEQKNEDVKDGVITRNEGRAIDGREPIEGGDDLLVQSTLVPITQLTSLAALNMENIVEDAITLVRERLHGGIK